MSSASETPLELSSPGSTVVPRTCPDSLPVRSSGVSSFWLSVMPRKLARRGSRPPSCGFPGGPHLVQELRKTGKAGLEDEGRDFCSRPCVESRGFCKPRREAARLQSSYHLPLRCQETNWKIKAIIPPVRFGNSPLDRNHKQPQQSPCACVCVWAGGAFEPFK